MPAQPWTSKLIAEPFESRPGFALPDDALALVIIAHPDPASHEQPGQRFVEDVLRANRFAALSFSLRTRDEMAAQAPSPGAVEARRRVLDVLGRVAQLPVAGGRPVALLGVDGTVPACIAAAAHPGGTELESLLLMDGRPQRSQRHLARLRLPTLFIVGAGDAHTLACHRKAAAATCAQHRLEVLAQPTRPNAALGAYEAIACTVSAWVAWTLARGPEGPSGLEPTDRRRQRTRRPAAPCNTAATA